MRYYRRRSARVTNLTDAYILLVRIVMLTLVAIWRRLFIRTTFIAVTGSVGKTTSKECIAAVLSSRFRTTYTRGNDNHYYGIFMSLLRVRPWHRYAVIEIGVDGPGQMKWFARVVRPDIAVWLGVARTHIREYESIEQIAAEKSRLIDSLRPGGIAILNDDDPFVRAYQPLRRARVIRFGIERPLDLQAAAVESKWPGRLSFDVHRGTEQIRVVTQLVGVHWVPSVLAAVAVGLECGLSLSGAVAPIAGVPPFIARLSPVSLPQGAVILRDELNGSVETLESALRVLDEATADRKILVYSDMSDTNEHWRKRGKRIAREAARRADLAVFVGQRAKENAAWAVRAGMPADCAIGIVSLSEAADYLKNELRAGDLVLLKGRITDKLSRLYLAWNHEVNCWRDSCSRKELCDFCPELTQTLRLPSAFSATESDS